MKYLVLMRHAKSSWDQNDLSDKERPLNERGIKDAPIMGAELAERAYRPDEVWISSSQRTRETFELMQPHLNVPEDKVSYQDDLYLSHALELLNSIRLAPSDLSELMIIGHNPGLTDLVYLLTGYDINNMVTAGVVRIELDVDEWKRIGKNSGSIVYFLKPKELSSL